MYAWKFLSQLYKLLANLTSLTEIEIMLTVLGLIDVVMIANPADGDGGRLRNLCLALAGGTASDQPEWLDHVNASVLKVKLSMAIISISSIHLLQTFINAGQLPEHTIKWQLYLHLVFLLVSAAAIAYTDKLLHGARKASH